LSRSLDDDFEDDLPGGSLDLETGSHVGGGGGISTYGGGGGIDFDDELDGEGGLSKALELDLPSGGAAQARHAHVSAPPSAGGAAVPDLAFESLPSKGAPSAGHMAASRPSGQMAASRPSGQMAASRPSGQMAAVHPGGPPSGAMPIASSGASAGPSSVRPGHLSGEAAAEPLPPPKPSAAAIIAKYPAPPEEIYRAPRYALRVVFRQLELRSDLESLRRRRSPDVPLYEAALRAYDAKTFRLGMALNCAAFAVATFIFFLPVILRFVRAD
jgi:hypothetical protein